MKDFLVLLREDDGRTIQHSASEMEKHQLNWKNWLEAANQKGRLTGGKALTLRGNVIRNFGAQISEGPYANGKEIVGGYLLIKAESLEEATELMKSCPVFESDGFAEVREVM
jgi:hypothetical protein